MSTREYRLLISHRYSARWANRVNKIEWLDDNGTITDVDHIVVDDQMIVCDLCNANFPENYDAEIPILQHRWSPNDPWRDVGTRCPACLEGLEDTPRISEEEAAKCCGNCKYAGLFSILHPELVGCKMNAGQPQKRSDVCELHKHRGR